MYKNVFYDRQTRMIHLWDSTIGYKKFKYKKYAYIRDDNGEYKTIFGESVKKITFWEEGVHDLYESDVSPEVRTLVDLYYDYPDNEYPEHNILAFDIEVDTSNKLPDVEIADNEITGISYFDYTAKKYTSLILDKEGKVQNQEIDSFDHPVELFVFNDESNLLEEFIIKWKTIEPSIVTGWNVDGFDVPYLLRRLVRIFGQDIAYMLSPINKIIYSDFRRRFTIAGVAVLDYLELYKKFTFTQKPSYRLDAIANDELGKGKIEFEGTIQSLYERDINKFIEYNINDVELVVGIDNKRKLLDLVIGISHKGKIPYEDIYFSSRYLEGAILSDLKKKKLVSNNKPYKDISESKKFVGAFVKTPIPGKYDWVFDLDLTSLYPSIIMSLNISPDTKIGKILNWDPNTYMSDENIQYQLYSFDVDKSIEISKTDLKLMLEKDKYTIASNGVIYLPSSIKLGVIPEILNKWFNERVKYKNLMKKYGKSGDAKKYEFYDKLQVIQKTLLNSLYGVLGLPIFRYYDLDNASAVTITGQRIIKFSEYKANEFYMNTLNEEKLKDRVQYIDTDSIFLSASDYLTYKKIDINQDFKTLQPHITKFVNNIQKYINSAYDDFAKTELNIYDKHRFEIKQELICKSGIWVAKKRYGLLVVNREGIEERRLDVKGLDSVRSSFPIVFKGFMEKLLEDLLDGVDQKIVDKNLLEFEDNLNDVSLLNIARNTSINDIRKYTEVADENEYYKSNIFSTIKKGTPAHVKAAIAFNDLLIYHNLLSKYNKIDNGEKIKWVYLKNNSYGLEALAFRGYEDPPKILDFIEKYVDRQKIFERELKGKIQDILASIGKPYPTHATITAGKFFDF